MAENQWTIQQILNWTQNYLQIPCPDSPRLDAELLLGHVMGYSRLDLYLKADQPLREDEKAAYKQLIHERSLGCPVAYLMGEKEFWSLPLEVDRSVLIPRPDTEILIECASQKIQAWQEKHPEQTCKIFELGSGSGAIPLALCSEHKNLNIFSVDISAKALAVASKNRIRHENLLTPKNNKIELIVGDGFSAIQNQQSFDFIISNPPYIRSQEISKLQKDVTHYEPHIALDGGNDGLFFYRYLTEYAPKFLNQNGEMFLEIGFDQKMELVELIHQNKTWGKSLFHKDLNGNFRVWSLELVE